MIPSSKPTFPANAKALRCHFSACSKLSFITLLWLLLCSNSFAQTSENRMFSAAMEYIKQEQWPQAEGLLKFMLDESPEMHRARLELGLVYLKSGKIQSAEQHFQLLLSNSDVPAAVKHNIRQFLDEHKAATSAIKGSPPPKSAPEESMPSQANDGNETKQQIRGELQLSAGYDGNVRYSSADYFLEDDPYLDGVFIELEEGELVYLAPDGFVYDIDGTLLYESDEPFEFNPPDSSNYFIEAGLKLHHQYQINSENDLVWHNALSLQTTDNAQHSQYNKTQMRLETGLSWQITENWQGSVVAHHRLLERDGKVQIRATGIDPELTYYNAWGSWAVRLMWMERQYEDSVFITDDIETVYFGFSSTIREVSLKWSKLFLSNKLLLLTRLDFSDNKADDDFNYKGTRLTLASVYNFNSNWSLLVSATKFNQDYSESAGENLHDTSTSIRAKLTYYLNDDFRLFLAAERALRNSDVYGGINSDKSILQMGAELTF